MVRMKFVVAFGSLLLVLFLLVVGVSILFQPKDILLTDEQKVMKIAVDYIEKNYGTDYVLNGKVSSSSASFRIPADYFEAGQYVSLTINPDTEEIEEVFTSPAKGFAPYDINLSNWEREVRQSESTSTNITLTLIYSEEEKAVPLTLELGAYENNPVDPNYLFPFEAFFEPEQLVLKYQETKSAVLTLTASDDAPLGRYTIFIYANDGNKGIGATLQITVIE